MTTTTAIRQEPHEDWAATAERLATLFAGRAAQYDANDAFVAENYADLKAARIFSAAVPEEFGGGGASYSELCDLLRRIAQGCGSTALALSMHSHLLAATLWRLRQAQPVEPLLRRIAAEQTVLISTGASDWLQSSGRAERVAGGFRVNARKIFASGSPAGDLLITSACYDDPEAGPTVLHFPVPFDSAGVSSADNWRTLGMRGTASNDILLEDVFVPEAAVTLRRPQGIWHPFFNVVVSVAMPLIMSVYVGIAEAAAALTREKVQRKKHDPHLPYLLGEMENCLTTAQMARREMIALSAEYQFEPVDETANAVLQRKTIAANAVLKTVEKALEAVGGGGFFRELGLERLLRDVHGAQFHPLTEKRQQHFAGRMTLGLDPLG
jgi:acyl-CoA dehydrogenase